MNVEASNEAMEELTTTFRYNDAVIRNLVIRRDDSVTEESLIMKAEKEDRERKSRYQERQASERQEDDVSDDDSEQEANESEELVEE
jgi:small subunit ribosomal protein S6